MRYGKSGFFVLCGGALVALVALSGCCGSAKGPEEAKQVDAPVVETTSAAQTSGASVANHEEGICEEGEQTCGEQQDRSGSTEEVTVCGRLGWAGAAEDGKGYTHTQGDVSSLKKGSLVVFTYPWKGEEGTMRLTRSPRDPRGYVGTWTRGGASGKARLNFSELFTEGTGFWTDSPESRTRRRLTLKPCH